MFDHFLEYATAVLRVFDQADVFEPYDLALLANPEMHISERFRLFWLGLSKCVCYDSAVCLELLTCDNCTRLLSN